MTSASSKDSACLLIFTALTLLLAVCEASAAGTAQEEQYLVEYRAYSNALKGGDGRAAAAHGHAAWLAAEESLGDDRLTAILAFNYGRLVVFEDSESALAPLLRTRALQEAGVSDLPAMDVRLYADYVEFAAGGLERREADRLRETLTAIGPDAAARNPDLAPIWLQLARHDTVEERFRNALESAAAAEAAITIAAPDSPQSLAEAIMIGAIARLVPYPRKVEDVQAAHNGFVRALRLFPPQRDLDSFDPLLAKLLTWDKAATSVLKTLDVDDYPDHEGSETGETPPLPPMFEYQQDASLDCGEIEWLEREPPNYPSRALRRGSIGAVLLGYRLGNDLTVQDARVLAEVPVDEFGENALEAVTGWRPKALPSGGPACHRNLTTYIMFMIET